MGLYADEAGKSEMRFMMHLSTDRVFNESNHTKLISDYGTTTNVSNSLYFVSNNRLTESGEGRILNIRG